MISNRGLAQIALEEACVTVAFMDKANPAQGFSHHGPNVIIGGAEWTVEMAVAQMIADCHVNDIVLGRAIKVPLPPTIWDAIHICAYNLGAGTVSRSPIVAAINAGDLATAAALFVDSGWENPQRRAREALLFLHGNYTADVGGTPFGQMLLYTSDPHATPRPTPQVVPFPLSLED
jgi:GH24 family phage-related lysozyme (muramidase)